MRRGIDGSQRSAGWAFAVGALALGGCPKQELAPLAPCTVSAVRERVDQTGIADVDLLFIIDNSGSMASEQIKLAAQLPHLLEVLTSGDKYFGDPDPPDVPPKERYFTPVKSLHLGVVSTNMGGKNTFGMNDREAVRSCADLGDDGKLLNDTDIAVHGVTAEFEGEFEDYRKGDEVLPKIQGCELEGVPRYQEFVAEEGASADDAVAAFRCVSRLGVRGCPFEQQLEAMWKALAPSGGEGELYEFLDDSKGHGDGANRGFLRDEAVLAVMHVSDEEDCSIKQAGKVLFEDSSTNSQYGPINLRCGKYAEDRALIWPVERYYDGLRSLKPDYPDRIIFGAIVGIPPEAHGKPFAEILELPAMQFSELDPPADPSRPNANATPTPSCIVPGAARREEAYPPRRFVELASHFGDQAVVYSICADNYQPALDTLIEKIADKLKGNCLPRKLTRNDQGEVSCEVFELLPPGQDECSPARGHRDKPKDYRLTENGEVVTRRACQMDQVPVDGSAGDRRPREGMRGWYYDDFDDELATDCLEGEQQRISFQFANNATSLPSGAGAVFECFQPVARIESAELKGLDAVNASCEARDEICEELSNKKDGGYNLICIEGRTCQIACDANPDCPRGWVCETGQAGEAAPPKYCQLPTCPQDDPGGASAEDA